jgi:hypothetical protein
MAKVKKRVLVLSRWSNQLWKVTLCWCISKVTWNDDLSSYMVKWFKSHGLICVCFKRWDKDVCDPNEGTSWRNHTWDTNYSRSLLNYILFNLSIGIIVLSRGNPKQRLVFAKAQASIFKSYFENQNCLDTLCTTVVRIEKWRVFLLKNSWAFLAKLTSLVELTFSAELNFFRWVGFFSWVELLQMSWLFQLSWISTSTMKLSDQNQLNLPLGQLNQSFSPKLSGQNWLNWSLGEVQPVTGTSA